MKAAKKPIVPFLSPDKITAATASAHKRRDAAHVKTISYARDLIGLASGDDGHVFALTMGQCSQIDLIEAAMELTGPADVAVWTWCIADYELQRLSDLCHDGRITRLRLVVDRAGVMRQWQFFSWAQNRFGRDCIRVTKTHAKVGVVVGGGYQFCIRGSANLNANPRIDLLDVSNSADAVGMVEGVMEEIWRECPSVVAGDLANELVSQAFEAVFGAECSDRAARSQAATGGGIDLDGLLDLDCGI
jgi:hypothetical protein